MFTNDTFPRHRHDLFVSHIVAALERVLQAHSADDASGRIPWFTRRGG